MTIDFVTLLHQSDSLLLFVVLAFGLLLGKVRLGNFQIGNTIGVLFTALRRCFLNRCSLNGTN
ncbi:hypothetical protein [Aeromonas salmonicida]|uniref:hypothetical protein n=1 Tax=Aeromonas salmonicida TaxID=645 RepID=UPI00232C761F|nr:hypothetical protein [Aeromonas salmonicida]WCH38464.1 hypothetical protein ONZ57_13495 [Aeromonas salmonicida]